MYLRGVSNSITKTHYEKAGAATTHFIFVSGWAGSAASRSRIAEIIEPRWSAA
jgi:hypothetical protein